MIYLLCPSGHVDYTTFISRALPAGRKQGCFLMGFLTEKQALYAVVLVCLALVLMMVITLILMYRRSAAAEKQAKEIARAVEEKLAQTDDAKRESDLQARRELSESMQSVNDSVVRMMGEMTRTQQGQMDALGGQLRAASRQDEERMERMRQTMDRRLSSYEERIGGVNQALEEKLSGNEERMERMRQTIEGGLQTINEENRRQLEQMRQTVDEKLNATVEQRLEASFSAVTKRLEQVTAGLNAVQSLAGSVDELGRMVSGARPLGVIGEAQLGAILSQMLAPSQYAEHAPVRPNGEPVADYVVVMPGQGGQNTVYLPIDASLPMREYHELCTAQESGTRAEIESARGLLESAVRMHARRMSEKLIAPPYTTDYAVLFLPSEGLYAEVLHISGLSERVQQESRMVVAGPTTLAALISSLQLGFKSLAIEQRTQEVMNLLGAIRTDFAGFASLLGRTQKKLRQATEELDHAQQHTQTIAKRLSDVNGLPESEAKKLLGLSDEEDDDSWD